MCVANAATPVWHRSNLAATERTREMLKERGTEAILRKCAQANAGDQMLSQLINRTALPNLKKNGTQVFEQAPATYKCSMLYHMHMLNAMTHAHQGHACRQHLAARWL